MQEENLSRQEVQAKYLIGRYTDQHGRRTIETAPNPMEGDTIRWPVEFMYARDHILVREDYLERARALVDEVADGPREGSDRDVRPVGRPVVLGLYALTLPPKVQVTQALQAIQGGGRSWRSGTWFEGLGEGAAGPDHLVSIAPTAGTCPAKEPEAVPPDSVLDPAPTLDTAAGRGVRIVVVDTGVDPAAVAAHPWLTRVTGTPDPAVGPGPANPRRPLASYAGHGTFIAGIIRTVAPRAEVHVRADFQIGGSIFESDLIKALEDVLANDNPDIISMSAGVWDNVAGGPVGFQVFYEQRLRHHKGVVLVTAAGNDSSRQPFWPAASPWTVSVGALRPDWRQRAKFSNFGAWVDVYAPGEDLVNAFPVGHYVYTEPDPPAQEATFTGLAKWSGTSFSAPMVAGMIAARMSRTGENGVTAAAALLKIAQTQARLGTGAVLLPS